MYFPEVFIELTLSGIIEIAFPSLECSRFLMHQHRKEILLQEDPLSTTFQFDGLENTKYTKGLENTKYKFNATSNKYSGQKKYDVIICSL